MRALAKPTKTEPNESVHWAKYYATALMCLTVAFLFADQNLLAPNLTRIAKEFHFSDQMRDDK